MALTKIDLLATALDRLAYQYRDSPNLIAVLIEDARQMEELQDVFLQLELLRSIDLAEGDALDGIGEIVGQPRELSGVIPVEYFGYRDVGVGAGPAEFGDTTDPSVGSRYRSINENAFENRALGDAEYRILIRAKIIRNKTRATPEDIIKSIRAVLSGSATVLLTFGTGSTVATVQRTLSAEELATLNASGGIRGEIPVIPRAIGTSLTVAGI